MTIIADPKWPFPNFSWYLDDGRGDPDLVEVGDENHRLVNLFEGSALTIPLTVTNQADTKVRFVSPQNQPNTNFWGLGEDPDFNVRGKFRVLTSDDNVQWRINVHRVDFEGRFIQNYANTPFDIPTFPPGFKNWNTGAIRDQSQPDVIGGPHTPVRASDRIRLDLVFVTSLFAGQFIEIEVGTDDSFVEVPIAMGLSRIVFDGTSLSLPNELSGWRYRRRANRNLVISQGGVPTTSVRHLFDEVEATWNNMTDTAFEESLRAFFAWASTGNPFAFSRDVTDSELTNLQGTGASGGQKNIEVADESGFADGNSYLLRQTAGDREEMITVQSTSPNFVVATANLKFSYIAGDVLKSRYHFPKLVLLDSDDPVTEGLTWYDFTLRAREDRS